MDLLSDILEQAGLQRRLLDLRHLAEHTALRFPCEKSIGFHVVTHGRAFIHGPSLAEPLALMPGDLALMARGCHHVVGTQAALPPGPIPLAPGLAPATGDAAPPPPAAPAPGTTVLISGAYQFWNAPLHPLFAELPPWTVLRAESLPRLAPLSLTVALLGSEVAAPSLGSEGIVHGLLDVSFSYLLREIVMRQGTAPAGWGQALRDPPVRQAVELLHADTGHGWTLDELARRVGVSRTALAGRFREAMGDTPLNYLRTLRMQRAVRLLSTTDAALDHVATQVGYTDAFSFSKVFKKVVGMPPREFRRLDRAERGVAWRF